MAKSWIPRSFWLFEKHWWQKLFLLVITCSVFGVLPPSPAGAIECNLGREECCFQGFWEYCQAGDPCATTKCPPSPVSYISHGEADQWLCEFNPQCKVESAGELSGTCSWVYNFVNDCPSTDYCVDGNGVSGRVGAQSCGASGCVQGGWYKSCCNADGSYGVCDAIPLVRSCTVGTITGSNVTSCTGGPTATPVPGAPTATPGPTTPPANPSVISVDEMNPLKPRLQTET